MVELVALDDSALFTLNRLASDHAGAGVCANRVAMSIGFGSTSGNPAAALAIL